MSGIILLLVLAIWVYVVKKLTDFFVRKMPESVKKILIAKVLVVLLLIAPVADDIAGGFQFRALCEEGTRLIYEEEKVKGKKLLWVGGPRTLIKGTIIPISEMAMFLVDLDTKAPLIEYKKYYATGGWLSRTVAFNSSTKPYTFDGVCGAKEAISKLRTRLSIKTTFTD